MTAMTMIPVNDRYRIELDSHSWQISKLKGKSGWRGVAWFPALTQAFYWLAERGLREAGLQGAEDVVHALCTLQHALEEAINRASFEDTALRKMTRVGYQRPEGEHNDTNEKAPVATTGAEDAFAADPRGLTHE